MKKNVNISIVRIVSMFMILICHFCNEMGNKLGSVLGQTFNVGVFIFIIISGYLFGKKNIDKPANWIIKRIKKIMIPVWIWVAVVNIIYLLKGIPLNFVGIISYIFDMQGWFGIMNGLEHLWFLSVIMICYFVTPFLEKIRKNQLNFLKIIVAIFIASIIFSFVNVKLGRYIFDVNLYISAYYYSFFENKFKKNKTNIFTYMGIIILSMITRVICRKFLDETVVYTNIVVLYTQSLIAFSVFRILQSLKIKNIKLKIVEHLDEISYYIYIVHYVFCVGPVDILGKWGKNYIIQLIVTIILSYVCAVLLRKVTLSCNNIFIGNDKKINVTR